MKCPHCLVEYHPEFSRGQLRWNNGTGGQVRDVTGYWSYRFATCPACDKVAIWLSRHLEDASRIIGDNMVHPKGIARSPLPPQVIGSYVSDYREACNVLADSPKASAALGRRCLQSLLRDKGGVKKGNLNEEIEEVIKNNALPGDLADGLHHVRVIGNFAAHPEKSVNTGAIVDVEPGEAEWTLDILESLFEFYFVRPAKLAARKAELNKKLGEAGKKPLP